MSNPSDALAQQVRRDLRWIADCPDLLDDSRNLPFSLPDEDRIDFDGLVEWLSDHRNHRVGRYFERLVHAALQATPDIADIRANVGIVEQNRTLGEVDFLFERDGRPAHLEVAVKFYLASVVAGPDGSQHPGPNSSDSFEKKRDRLFEHQLPLGKARFPEIEASHILVKGIVFHPGSGSVVPPPAKLNPSHSRGLWLSRKDALARQDEFLVVPMPKPFWFSTPEEDPRPLREWISSPNARLPTLFATDPGKATESRLMIVDDDWPNSPVA